MNPFFDRSSIPKLARATKPRGARDRAVKPQSGNPLSARVAHASNKETKGVTD